MRRRLLLLGIGLLCACQTPDVGRRLAGEDTRPQRLVQALYQRAQARRALRGRARLSLDAPGLYLRRPQRLAVERPARMRLEILGLFDQVAAILVTDGRVYQFFDAGKGTTERGPADAALLWRVARVDLEPREAVGFLLGSPLPRPGLSPGEARAFENGDVLVERRDASAALRERLRFDAHGRLLRLSRFDRGGELVFDGRFQDYRELPGPGGQPESFAFTLELRFPRVSARMVLRYERVELLDALPDALFELPEGRAAPNGSETS